MARKKATKRKVRRSVRPSRQVSTGIDRNFEDFIEEISEHGKHLHARREHTKDWWFSTFGVVGPLLGAVIGMVVVAIIAFVISIVNIAANAPFLSMLSSFLNVNLPVFLLIFLVVNYLKHIYLSKEKLYYLVKPIKVAFEIAVAFWLLAWVMQFAGMQLGNIQLVQGSLSIMSSLSNIFFVFLVLGYIVALVKREREDYGS